MSANSITSEQADRIIALLEQIVTATQANAVVCEAIHAQQMVPVLERRHLEAQSRMHIAEAERESERRKVAEQLEHARRPRLFARVAPGGFGGIVERAAEAPELPEGKPT